MGSAPALPAPDERMAVKAVVGAAAWRTSLPATMQILLFIGSYRAPPTGSCVPTYLSRHPAWRMGGLGGVADELAGLAVRLDPG